MTVTREFVSLTSATGQRHGAGGHPCQGIYYRPAGRRPKVGLIAVHYNVDFSEHYMAERLAARGLGFLGWNTRFRGSDSHFLLEHALIDIGAGVSWLRAAGADTVVLLGNSGGASLMAAYQSQAIAPIIRPAWGQSLPDAVLTLPAGDLFVSLCAHLGRPEVLTSWLDPSVADESDPLSSDPTLDMYGEHNRPPYAPDFVSRYRAAQAARNQRITAWAVNQLELYRRMDLRDRTFQVFRLWADLRFLDLTMDPSDRPIGCYHGDPRGANYGSFGIGQYSTLRTWLSMWSLDHSDCGAVPHLRRLATPAYVLQSLADTGVYPSDARLIHEAIGADDKQLDFMGGDHYLRSPAGARDEAADRIAAWIAAHSR